MFHVSMMANQKIKTLRKSAVSRSMNDLTQLFLDKSKIKSIQDGEREASESANFVQRLSKKYKDKGKDENHHKLDIDKEDYNRSFKQKEKVEHRNLLQQKDKEQWTYSHKQKERHDSTMFYLSKGPDDEKPNGLSVRVGLSEEGKMGERKYASDGEYTSDQVDNASSVIDEAGWQPPRELPDTGRHK